MQTCGEKKRSPRAVLLEVGSSFPPAVLSGRSNWTFFFCIFSTQTVQCLSRNTVIRLRHRGPEINQHFKNASVRKNCIFQIYFDSLMIASGGMTVEVEMGQCYAFFSRVFIQLVPGYMLDWLTAQRSPDGQTDGRWSSSVSYTNRQRPRQTLHGPGARLGWMNQPLM